MITRVVHPFNLQRALEHVIANKGSAGVDGVSIRELRKAFSEKKLQLIEAIKQGNYQVQPILGIEIPKGNGKTRLLGVPTTTERVLQQALAQTIAPLFEPDLVITAMDLDLTRMPDKPLDNLGITSIQD